jgi:nucleoside-diphosphate-sugar epimerase
VSPKHTHRLAPSLALRIVADALMLQCAMLAALAVSFLFYLTFRLEAGTKWPVLFAGYLERYLHAALPLTVFCLIVFYLSGFYTRGMYYQGKYKALIVLQAVSFSYLLLAFLWYLCTGFPPLPRLAYVLSWVFSCVLLIGARLWLYLWNKVTSQERGLRLGGSQRQGTVLVIGGAGYIGSALLHKLLDRGYRVRLLDLLWYGTQPIQDIIDHSGLELIRGDFRHVAKLIEAMRGVDAVVHLGGIVGDPACELDRELTSDVNLFSTRTVAEVAKLSGVRRFVFASTCSVYGACDELLDEYSQVQPVSHYGNTKLAAERVLREMSDEEFAPTILRFATIYGLSGRTRFDLVVNLFAAKAKIDGTFTVMGGEQWRPFVHVDDAAEALMRVLEVPLEAVGNEIFNVGSDEQNYTIREIGELVRDHVPSAEMIVNAQVTDARNYRVSFAKIRQQLSFEPKWTLAQGIQQVLEAIARGEVGDYRDPKYSNVQFLSTHGIGPHQQSEHKHAFVIKTT